MGNPVVSVPQAGVLRLETNLPARVTVTVAGGGEEWSFELAEATSFESPVVGVKPDTAYRVTLRAKHGDDTLRAGPLRWTSPPLPSDFPRIELVRSEPTAMEPGMTLFNVNVYGGGPNPMVIVDQTGVVRWYYLDPTSPVREDARRLDDGHFLFVRDRCSVLEVDVLGNAVGAWHAAAYPRRCDPPNDSVAVPLQSIHHDIHPLPDGNFLALATESRLIENYPTSEDDENAPRQTALVVGGVIVEFSRKGELVKYIPLMDLLDPTRIGRGSLSTSWSSWYVPEGELAYDWDHANSVIYDEKSDAYYVSLRHQDAIVKVSRADQQLIWILGTPKNWGVPWADKLLTPVGDFEWPFHQHAARLNPLGLALYDNGNNRAAAFEPVQDDYSRAVIYDIDEAASTVAQVWSYGEPAGPASFFSETRGNVDWQPTTGNRLLVNGNCRSAAAIAYAKVLEVTPEGERVFELDVGDPADTPSDPRSHSIYRVQRFADLRQSP